MLAAHTWVPWLFVRHNMSTSAAATTVEANANQPHTLEPANPATSNVLSSAQPSPPLPFKTPQQMAEMFTQGNSQKQKVMPLAASHDMLETAFAVGSTADGVAETVGSASASSSGEGTSR